MATVRPLCSLVTFDVSYSHLAPNTENPPPTPEGYVLQDYRLQKVDTEAAHPPGDANSSTDGAAPASPPAGAVAGA